MDIKRSPLVDGFDRVLLDVALKRENVEAQCPTDLDRRDLPQPGLAVDGVHLEAEVLGGFPRIQEPLADYFITHQTRGCGHGPMVRAVLDFQAPSEIWKVNGKLRWSGCGGGSIGCMAVGGAVRQGDGVRGESTRQVLGVDGLPAVTDF